MQRNQKTVSLIYLVCGVVCWLIFRELITTVWLATGFTMPLDWIIPPADIVSVAIGLVAFIILLKNNKVNEFTNEVITELERVVWPQKKETALSTVVVSILVGICSLIFFAFDMLWGSVVRYFYQ